MKKFALASVGRYVVTPFVSAHEGHDHKIMGTLAAVHDHSVDVKATDGKLSTITLNDKTKILHGTTAMKLADLKTGDRVVVTATGGGRIRSSRRKSRSAARWRQRQRRSPRPRKSRSGFKTT